jgi:hypothetical protein
MFQANPSLGPGLAKFILMYTAEKMDDESILAQGSGYLNAEGAVRMAATLRQDLNTLAEGDDLLPQGASVASASLIEGELILFGSGILYRGATVGSDAHLYRPGDPWGDGVVWGDNLLYRGGESIVDPLALIYRPQTISGLMDFSDADASSPAEGIVQSTGIIYRPQEVVVWGTSLLDPTSLGASSEEVLTDGILYVPPSMSMAGPLSIYYPKP